jgi:simple sugar transport system ATP-binding protein
MTLLNNDQVVPRLEVRNICKSFGSLKANDHISFRVLPGEVHCLLGENGAGKTTVMNIVYGLYRADEGQIFLDGRPIVIRSPHEAIALGIGMVHQHFMLVPTLTVAENIILGTRPLFFSRSSLLTNTWEIEQEVKSIAERYSLKINPSALVSSLSVGEQQRVEIVKALYRGVRLLILDEPTAVLTPQETLELFDTLRILVRDGLSVIFISHKLNEIMVIGDRVTILRDGKVVGEKLVCQTNTQELAELMVGREVKLTVEKKPASPGEEVLVVKDLNIEDHGVKTLRGVSFSVRSGEIVGIAGVDGNGQRELALALAGMIKPSAGTIKLCGMDLIGKSPAQIFRAGVCHIPEDRQKMGLVMDFSVAENFVLKKFSSRPFVRHGLLHPKEIFSYALRLTKEFDVRTPSVKKTVDKLSGGNQQKIVLGREIDQKPKLLIAMQPTRGLDVGATEYIHQQLLAQRDRGAAILLISTELEEVMALSDRILVMYEGQIVGETLAERSNVEQIGLWMAGVRA